MLSKSLWYLLAVLMIVGMVVYFFANPSYEKSLESKFYYTIGSYKEAYAKASEAFELNPYNRMAATVMAQSKTALKYVDYIEEAETYMKQISEIANSNGVTDAQKAKMKIMCEIMMDRYVKLAPSVVTDEELVEKVDYYYEQFVSLHEKISQAL